MTKFKILHMLYNIIGAEEKQAAPKATFVFHAHINEQAACEAGYEAP